MHYNKNKPKNHNTYRTSSTKVTPPPTLEAVALPSPLDTFVLSIYKLGYVKRGSTAFKVPKDGCGVPSAARALLGPDGLLMR